MQHFVCVDGCGGESGVAKVCETEGCKHEGEPLRACNCEDGLHEGVEDASEDKEDEA